MTKLIDTVNESCFEASTRFVRGHSGLVEIPKGELREATEIVSRLESLTESVDGELGTFAVEEQFRRLKNALAGYVE